MTKFKTKNQILTLLNKGLKVKCNSNFNYNSKEWEFTNIRTSKEYKENYLDLSEFLSMYK